MTQMLYVSLLPYTLYMALSIDFQTESVVQDSKDYIIVNLSVVADVEW